MTDFEDEALPAQASPAPAPAADPKTVDVSADLRAAFYVEGETVWSVSIGTHDINKG